MEKHEILAERAYELCQQAYRNKNIDLARVYLMNALTHNTELAYLKALVTIVKRTPFVQRKNVAQQALNMFSMALFQAPADQIEEISRLNVEMQELYDDTFAFEGTSVNSESATASGWAEFLDVYAWSNLRHKGLVSDLPKIRERLGVLQKMLDSGSLNDSRRRCVEEEYKTTAMYLEFLEKESTLKDGIRRIEIELSEAGNQYYISAKLQTLAAVLTELWSLDVAAVIPKEQLHNVLQQYVKKLESLEIRYMKLQGQSLFDELCHRITVESRETKDGRAPKTVTLGRWRQLLQSVSGEMQKLQAPEHVDRIKVLIQGLSASIERISYQRYAEYQAFCAAKCRSAIKDFDNTIRVGEADAKVLLERWELAKINEGLLSPEASGLFHEAKGMLVDKLSRVDRADFQIECVTGKKFELEDF